DGSETRLPNERTMDIDPVWLGETVYFLSDRDWATNVWAYDTRTAALRQLTHFTGADVKSLGGDGSTLVFEEDGWLWLMDPSPGAADRAPVWSPDGQRIAWVSDEGSGYRLLVGSADGLGAPRAIDIGDAKMVWDPTWSPDGNHIAFVDNKVRLRVIDVATGRM